MKAASKTGLNTKQPTALVAGGAGFIGSHLCEVLLTQGFNVVAVDNLSIPKSKKNIESLLSSRNFAFWEEDISKPEFKLSPTVLISHIFHLASIEEHLAAKELSLQTLLVNSLGTKNLLDLALERKAKFILVSSTEVFHGALSQTSLETYFNRPSDPAQISFSEAKRFAETLAAEYFKNYRLATTIIRIKDPYGPRMDISGGTLLGKFINAALDKKKIEIIGDGLKTLNPTYITDIIFGIIKASLKERSGEIYNVINPQKYTERSIAEQLKKIVGGVEIDFRKGGELSLPTYPLIISPTEERLKWEPKVPLAQGLRDTISYYRRGGNIDGKKVAPSPRFKLPEVEITIPKKGPKFLGKLIVLAISGLIFWIGFLPAILLAANIYTGNQNIQKASENLKIDKLELANSQSKSAQASFKNSQRNIQNILWLNLYPGLKDSGSEVKNYLFVAESISSAVNLSAQVLSSIDAAFGVNAPGKKIAKLKEAQNYINLANRALRLSESVQINEKALPAQLRKPLQELRSSGGELRDILNSLESSLQSEN